MESLIMENILFIVEKLPDSKLKYKLWEQSIQFIYF